MTGDIQVMNPELIICHLDDGATLNMEITADTGKGYVPAVANRPADAPIGLIPVDSLYSPVRQVLPGVAVETKPVSSAAAAGRGGVSAARASRSPSVRQQGRRK